MSDIQGWFDFEDIYMEAVSKAPPGATLIELGVWKGRSLVFLGCHAKAANKRLRVVGVDTWDCKGWDGYTLIERRDFFDGERRTLRKQCEENLAEFELKETVRLVESDTIEAAKLFEDASVSFLFIDDTHDADHVRREISAWLPKMAHPSIMAGHDFPGQIEAGVLAHFPNVNRWRESWIQKIP